MKYRKKPVVIDAMQVTEATPFTDVATFVGKDIRVGINGIVIDTLEGELHVSPDDWIIRGVKGEFYPCKPDIFAATYEPVEIADSEASTAQIAETMRKAKENPGSVIGVGE
jgi:hypothetical protein